MPKELLIGSEPYSDIICSLIGVHFPDLPKVPPQNQLESSEQLTFDSDTDSETRTIAGDVVSIVTKRGTREEATYALKRPRVGN